MLSTYKILFEKLYMCKTAQLMTSEELESDIFGRGSSGDVNVDVAVGMGDIVVAYTPEKMALRIERGQRIMICELEDAEEVYNALEHHLALARNKKRKRDGTLNSAQLPIDDLKCFDRLAENIHRNYPVLMGGNKKIVAGAGRGSIMDQIKRDLSGPTATQGRIQNDELFDT